MPLTQALEKVFAKSINKKEIMSRKASDTTTLILFSHLKVFILKFDPVDIQLIQFISSNTHIAGFFNIAHIFRIGAKYLC